MPKEGSGIIWCPWCFANTKHREDASEHVSPVGTMPGWPAPGFECSLHAIRLPRQLWVSAMWWLGQVSQADAAVLDADMRAADPDLA